MTRLWILILWTFTATLSSAQDGSLKVYNNWVGPYMELEAEIEAQAIPEKDLHPDDYLTLKFGRMLKAHVAQKGYVLVHSKDDADLALTYTTRIGTLKDTQAGVSGFWTGCSSEYVATLKIENLKTGTARSISKGGHAPRVGFLVYLPGLKSQLRRQVGSMCRFEYIAIKNAVTSW